MRLLAVVGPTATGKTRLAVAVARRLGSAELLNADSRQVVRGLRVGTCAPTDEELQGVRCHLLDLHDPGEPFSVADWLAAAHAALGDLGRRDVQPVLVGGTGLYLSALVDGLDLARVPADPARRAERAATAAEPGGLERLAAELARRDPEAAAGLDLRNPRRVIRALEILDAHGPPLGRARGRGQALAATLIGIDVPRELHERWIAARARAMLETGALVDEVHSAMARGISRDALDSAGIGYREALAVLDGRVTPEQAAEMLARRTRRYAKAQRTWFRRDPRIRWLRRDAESLDMQVDEVLDAIREDARAGQRLPGRR
jgi:tRNA dimethylallyltransferase